jgi:hypothetical protein
LIIYFQLFYSSSGSTGKTFQTILLLSGEYWQNISNYTTPQWGVLAKHFKLYYSTVGSTGKTFQTMLLISGEYRQNISNYATPQWGVLAKHFKLCYSSVGSTGKTVQTILLLSGEYWQNSSNYATPGWSTGNKFQTVSHSGNMLRYNGLILFYHWMDTKYTFSIPAGKMDLSLNRDS